MKKTNREIISKIVYDFKLENKLGFNPYELFLIVEKFPNMNIKKFDEALIGVTCGINEKGKHLIYHVDVITAILCGVEDRDMTILEWD